MVEDPRGAGITAPFEGVIGQYLNDSEAWYPPKRSPGSDAPNVVVIVLDDTGFAHLGCYGSDIDTSNIDRLASNGLRYNNFHTTALCSPTRAALLTGHNHHTVGMRFVSNVDAGFPNSRGALSTETATLAEILREQGYATFAVGKWHLANTEDCGPAGPFNHWPLQRGFDRYYGFLGGATDQFSPELVVDNHVLEPQAIDGYHLSNDLVDQAITMVSTHRSLQPERPFFCYLAFGATHSPHQAPPEYIQKYKGAYSDGWDVVRKRWFERQIELGIIPTGTEMAERNPGVPAWDALPEEQQELFAHMQEVFAGFLDHTDDQIGRFVAELEALDCLDNTVILLISDNGASQEGGHHGTVNELRFFNAIPENIEDSLAQLKEIGGPRTYNNYPRGWAQVGNTPLRFYKQNTYEGGIRDPLIVHWPNGIDERGAIRTQYHHVVDVTPTILEAIGVAPPTVFRGVEQRPMAGTSFVYTFKQNDGVDKTRKPVQYYEMLGHRAIWADGWKAVTMHREGTSFDDDEWTLHDTKNDFAETNDLSQKYPEILERLKALWWEEATKHGVLPLDDRGNALFTLRHPEATDRLIYRFPTSLPHIERTAVPDVRNRRYRISAKITRITANHGGVIVALGSSVGGYVLFIKDGHLHYEYNKAGTVTRISSSVPVPTGEVEVAFEFKPTANHFGRGQLEINGNNVGEAEFDTLPVRQSLYGMSIGRDAGPTVSAAYEGPFAFDGVIEAVVFNLNSSTKSNDTEAEFRASISEQ